MSDRAVWPTFVDCSFCGATLDTEGWGEDVFCPYCHKPIKHINENEEANEY